MPRGAPRVFRFSCLHCGTLNTANCRKCGARCEFDPVNPRPARKESNSASRSGNASGSASRSAPASHRGLEAPRNSYGSRVVKCWPSLLKAVRPIPTGKRAARPLATDVGLDTSTMQLSAGREESSTTHQFPGEALGACRGAREGHAKRQKRRTTRLPRLRGCADDAAAESAHFGVRPPNQDDQT